MAISLETRQKLVQSASPRQMEGLRLLAKSLPELRTELMDKIAANPAIEDIDHPLETPLSEIEGQNRESGDLPDYPEDDFEPLVDFDVDAAAARRQAFFDKQVKAETLQEHLTAQFATSDLAPEDYALAEMLVGDLDGNGRYVGSIPDVCMAFGRTEAEVVGVLRQIQELDPPGCGARSPRECLLAQLDKLNGTNCRETVRRMITDHFEDLASGRAADVQRALGLTPERYAEALNALRTLEAYPGRPFPDPHDRVEYVNPEVHAVRRDGYWLAKTDSRSLPTIHLSRDFLDRLQDPSLKAEDKAKMQAYVDQARELAELVGERRATVESVAQAIFDRQQDFFEQGFRGLKPLTETEIAAETGVTPSTVSRTVRDKYAATPFGTVELRRFFATGVKSAAGESVSREQVLEKLREIVASEDRANPLSDAKLSERLTAAGYPAARRTIVKYRGLAGIPGAAERKI